ncbi:hypothetical protein IWW38_005173 [Coemansia aciculifera]|uniref:Uncharacterized protein n=1 Tax=Coemansia aciculifera TaxID=417176 RepID=A0ACC1LVI0_9FUNG|nr:hypothetical protein IWW38_005173 [Coemansia aciculifera]
MADSVAKNKILVLGRPNVNKTQIIHSVVSQTPLSYTSEVKSGNDEVEEDSAKIEWTLHTRYYQAQLVFWADHTEQLPPRQLKHMQEWLADPDLHSSTDDMACDIPVDPDMAQLQEHLSEVVDAIIFVFDPTDPSSFMDILPWARFAKLHEPGVLLCVAATRDGKPVDTDDKDGWFDWCVVNGWEWLDLTDTDPDTEYTIERIREALESNEWDGMETVKKTNDTSSNLPDTDVTTTTSTHDDVATAEPLEQEQKGEWDGFDDVARTLDPDRVDAMHHALFSGENEHGDMATVLARLRSMRDEISQMDQSQARSRAAELAMAVAKKLP